jgi:hypothetical protein
MLLIGSHALQFHGIDTGRRKLDYDVIGSFDELGTLTGKLRKECRVMSIPLSVNKTVLKCDDGRIFEFEIAWPETSAHELLHYDPFRMAGACGVAELSARLPTLDMLYTLKMSHRYLKNSPHFRKTRDDIMLMRSHGAKIFDAGWLKRREDETYWYKHPKLNVKKDDFFKGDGVKYVYDHDDIHHAVAHVNVPRNGTFTAVPAYTLYMKDGEQVQCSKEKFNAVEENIRLYGVLEEAYVLALERSQIPFRGKVTPRKSFDMALMKVCTSITSGWFREFAWENFDRVEAMYSENYVERFWNAVERGDVRDFDVSRAY